MQIKIMTALIYFIQALIIVVNILEKQCNHELGGDRENNVTMAWEWWRQYFQDKTWNQIWASLINSKEAGANDIND